MDNPCAGSEVRSEVGLGEVEGGELGVDDELEGVEVLVAFGEAEEGFLAEGGEGRAGGVAAEGQVGEAEG